MKSGAARFFCWVLAIASMLASIIILVGPILDLKVTLIDFLKVPWCIAALCSPYVLMLFFTLLRGENISQNLCCILLPLGAFGLSILFAFESTKLTGSEQDFIGMLYFIAALSNVILSFFTFAAIINEDDGHSSSDRSDDDDLKWATGDEGYIDTTGLWP